MIELKNISASYPNDSKRLILDHVSLAIPPRQTLVLLGGSGAGKSTIIKTILRLIPISSGTIMLDEVDIKTLDTVSLRRKIGMVFQGIALFPHLTIAENIGLTLRLSGASKSAVHKRVCDLLYLVGLEPGQYEARYPHMLSGGEQQRVGVARALVHEPHYLLMDEPFGALDAITRRKLQLELKILRKQLDITILFVTHDVMEAVTLGDQLAVMHQGNIVQVGALPQLIEHPAHEVVNQLVATPLRELETFVRDHVA